MRKLILALLVIVLAMPLSAGAKMAKTIDELAAMYDSTRCKQCHSQIYAQWEKSHHARSLMGVQGGMFLTPLAMKGRTPFSPPTPGEATIESFPCFKCHLPQARTSAEDSVAAELAQALLDGDRAKVAKLNINCLVCHNEKAIIHKLEDGYPEENVIYGTKDVASHPDKIFKKVKKSAIIHSAIMCGQCHGQGPNLEFENPVQCATLYGSYQHNYIAGGGTKTCQDCHMEKINGKADHLIAPNWNDIAAASKILQNALSLNVETLGYEWLKKKGDLRSIVVVGTSIDSNAGHRVPDG